MYVTYRPEGGAEQRWTFDPKRVRASKAEMIEKRFGGNWEAFLGSVQSGSMKARRVLLWHLLTLEHHGLRFEDIPDFYADELLVEHSTAELQEIRGQVAKISLPEGEREQMLSSLDLALAEAAEREADLAHAEAEPEGKARSKRGASATP